MPSVSLTAERKSFSMVTSKSPGRSLGRRLMAGRLVTTPGKAVTSSRSSMVKTVSRCRCARSLVIIAVMTCSAAPCRRAEPRCARSCGQWSVR